MLYRILNYIEGRKLVRLILSKYDQIYVSGLKRRGKSMLQALLGRAYDRWKSPRKTSKKIIRELNKTYGNLNMPDSLVYSDTNYYFTNKRQSNYVKLSQFGLPNSDNKDIVYAPPYSYWSFDESQKELSSHAQRSNEQIERGVQLAGHNNIKLCFASQREDDVMARIKQLSDVFIVAYRKAKITKICGRVVRAKGYYIMYNYLSDALARKSPKAKRKDGEFLVDRVIKKFTVSYYGDIGKLYDSKFYFSSWYKDIENHGYQTTKVMRPKLTKASIKQFNDTVSPFRTIKSRTELRTELNGGLKSQKK